MKKILAHLAKRFRTFTTNSSRNDPEPVSASESSTFSAENDAFAARRKNPTISGSAISPAASRQPTNLHSQQSIQKLNEASVINSSNPDFITRQELERELELLRRLIESRK